MLHFVTTIKTRLSAFVITLAKTRGPCRRNDLRAVVLRAGTRADRAHALTPQLTARKHSQFCHRARSARGQKQGYPPTITSRCGRSVVHRSRCGQSSCAMFQGWNRLALFRERVTACEVWRDTARTFSHAVICMWKLSWQGLQACYSLADWSSHQINELCCYKQTSSAVSSHNPLKLACQ